MHFIFELTRMKDAIQEIELHLKFLTSPNKSWQQIYFQMESGKWLILLSDKIKHLCPVFSFYVFNVERVNIKKGSF